MELNLPAQAVPDRISISGGTGRLKPFERRTFAELDGPGCIRHIWVTMTRTELTNRKAVLRIFFDNEPVPYVEAPVGDFFGVMHGKTWYPVNTPYLSVKAESGYNCYFPMPFAASARIEFEAGDAEIPVYLMIDWHRYPDRELRETRRFCARWRREMPTQAYGDDFLMMDADGPGQLLGFAYGVRLMDDTDRWSHGGADNIYLDGEGDHPAYLRGIGGEDTFGTSYGGALHPPETHLYAAMPYYLHEDVGQARPAQRLVGYRFFEWDTAPFRRSIHMRFGCMRNEICATTYWYQEGIVRPFFRLPDWPQLMPGAELPAGTCDLAPPSTGSWWLCGPFGVAADTGTSKPLIPAKVFSPTDSYDGKHDDDSPWTGDASRSAGLHRARWVKREARHGFIDFNHVFRPRVRGVAPSHPGFALARCVLDCPAHMHVRLRFAWDDCLTLQINDEPPQDLGEHSAFRPREVEAPLRSGTNKLVLKLTNTAGSNHGGWCFAFSASAPDGSTLHPRAE